jgi:hypothetical protein
MLLNVFRDGGEVGQANRLVGPTTPFHIDETAAERLDSTGAFRLFEIGSKPRRNLTELEESLLRAVH